MVVRLSAPAFCSIDVQRPAVRAGAGANLVHVVSAAVQAGLGGLETLVDVPGTVGGAVYGNAGCYGGAMADSVTHVELWRGGNITSVGPHELGFSYRSSALKRHVVPKLIHGMHVGDIEPIVVGATIQLTQEDPQLLATHLAQTAALRKSKTPQGSSCGSVFKNPPGDSAGRLIEAAGLKGASVGAACVADKHANYIINKGGATSADVSTLVAHIRATVQAQFAVTLEPEVQILGAEWPFNA
jgi:UDP-N-acetylmuramate dehydrogenase